MSTNYSNNSIKNRDKKEPVEGKTEVKKVIKGVAKTKQKSEMSKIASNMISEEVNGIKEYVIYDVLIPVVKDTITQLIKGSVDMLFYGEVRHNSNHRSSGRSNTTRVSYNSMYDDRRDDRRDSRRSSHRVSYDDVSFEYKDDAEEVLSRMDEIVEQYGVVRVADYFEMAGFTGNGPTDHNYGWTSTRNASIERTRDGEYYIKIQRPSPIR